MKKRLIQGILTASALTLGLFAVNAFAEDIAVSTKTNVGVNIGTSVSAKASSSASVREDNEEDNDNDRGTTTENRDNDNDRGEIEIDHDSALKATSTIDRPEKVSNRGQLRSFLNHLIKGDDRISVVNIASTTISTTYKLPAKFLGIIPSNLPTNFVVNADGTITVSYPWYGFLFGKGDVEDNVSTISSSTLQTGTSTTLSASTEAHLLNLLFASLKASSETK